MNRPYVRLKTQQTAMLCAHYMHYKGFEPATIVNAGVGMCPEITIWRWLYNDAKVIGADPMPWEEELKDRIPRSDYIQALFGPETGCTRDYCTKCRSIMCLKPKRVAKHRRDGLIKKVRQTTIDKEVRKQTPPFFLWIDVDGAELEVLKGAAETLKHTGFVNVEMIWDPPEYDNIYKDGTLVSSVHSFLLEHGFTEVLRTPFRDSLYEKR